MHRAAEVRAVVVAPGAPWCTCPWQGLGSSPGHRGEGHLKELLGTCPPGHRDTDECYPREPSTEGWRAQGLQKASNGI